MKKSLIIAALFFLFLSALCFPVKKIDMKIFLTEKEDDANYQFYYANDYAVDDDLNIYIVDFKGCDVKKYDKNGKFIFSFGWKGSGPGAIQSPYGIIYSAGKIYIPQFKSLDVFSAKGFFEKSLSYPPKIQLGWLEIINGKIGVLKGIAGDKVELIVYSLNNPDKDVKKLASTEYSTKESRIAIAKNDIRFGVMKNDAVVFGNINEVKVQKYSFKDNSFKTIINGKYTRKKFSEDEIKRIKENQKKYFPNRKPYILEYHWLMSQISIDDSDNIWLNIKSNEKTGLMKFDPNGKFLDDYVLLLPKSEYDSYGKVIIKKNFIYSFIWSRDDGLNICRGTLK